MRPAAIRPRFRPTRRTLDTMRTEMSRPAGGALAEGGGPRRRALPAILLLATLIPAVLHAQPPRVQADAADWPTYNRDLAGTRYSPLMQINTDNVGTLRQAWSYALGRNPTTGDLGGGSEFTPLVIDGVMYLAGADHVVALEADTGEEIWRFNMRQGTPSRRGLAY